MHMFKHIRGAFFAVVLMAAAMGKAVDANFSVWPFNYQACWDAPLPAETYQLEIDRIIRLTDRRAAVLDTEFAK